MANENVTNNSNSIRPLEQKNEELIKEVSEVRKQVEELIGELLEVRKQNEELTKEISKLRRQNEHLQGILIERSKGSAQTEYKDKLFRSIFGKPENRQWTLSLYNAVNGSNYTDPDEISFNTLEDVLYVRMKNDVSFMFMSEMNLWEHQSTFNPNMPMRFFLYASRLYDKYVFSNEYFRYSSRLQAVPTPKCVCFYNGNEDQPDKMELRLSQAYGGDGDIEVRVTMLNINHGKNKTLMEACEPLREYSWFVDRVRLHQAKLKAREDAIKSQDGTKSQQTGWKVLDAAVDKALDEMPDTFVIKSFLLAHKAEIKGMFLDDYNEETFKREVRAEAYKDGCNDTLDKVNNRVATEMLMDGDLPISSISKYSHLPEDTIREMAAKLNVKL